MKLRIVIFIVFILIQQTLTSQSIEVLDERKLNLGLENQILVENHLTSNPANKNHLLLSGMFVDKNNPSKYGNYAAISLNKRKTWQNTTKFDIAEGAAPWGLITTNGVVLSTVLGLEELFIF